MQQRKIYLSYRRADSASASGRIYSRLASRYGKSAVCKDLDTRPSGRDLKHLQEAIQIALVECVLQLVVIGPRWLESRDEQGHRLLDNPEDPVRYEIETALRDDVPVIPLLVEGASMPPAEQLPQALQPMTLFHGMSVHNDPDFTGSLRRVERRITRALPLAQRVPIRIRRGAYAAMAGLCALLVTFAGLQLFGRQAPQQPAFTGALTAIAMASATDGWAVGRGGALLHFTGRAWKQIGSPTAKDLRTVALVSPGEGWAVGAGGTILHLTGGTWESSPSPVQVDLTGLALTSVGEGWAVGAQDKTSGGGTILHLVGGVWRPVPSPAAKEDLTGVALVSASEGWAVGSAGSILHLSEGAWTSVFSPAVGTGLSAVAVVSAGESWAVGQGGAILHEIDGSWIQITSPTTTNLNAVALEDDRAGLLSASDGWAAGADGTLLRYSGGVWTQAASPTSEALNGSVMVPPAETWIAGDHGELLHLTGGAWRVVSAVALS